MKKTSFKKKFTEHQIEWRKTNISTTEWGYQNKKQYPHIIPKDNWEETLWIGIRDSLPAYLKKNQITPHTGVHNLMSSWIVSANLYFPLKDNPSLKLLMREFLKYKVSNEITSIEDIQLEFAFEDEPQLHPSSLLGEKDGNRGSGQTSPDVAFIVKTIKGDGIILTECKFSEHSFYSCSARSKKERESKPNNPDSQRCMSTNIQKGFMGICHQIVWERKYWDNLTLSSEAKSVLHRCPAATAGYQLFRQQSLAEGISRSGKYDLVVSSVAFDARNEALKGCMKTTGIRDFQNDWADLWTGSALFKTWHHQEWVEFVRTHQKNGEHNDWLNYLKERYDY